jgi:hypothetical protein
MTNFFSSTVALLRRRPELAVFTVGLVLFAGGLASLIGAQLRPPAGSRLLAEQSSPEPKAGRVGPNPGEEVAPYIEKKKALTSQRASREPNEPTYGIVVFNSYRKASEVESLIKSRSLEAVAIQTRIPVASFKPKEISVKGRSLVAAALEDKEAVAQDLNVLEGIAVDVKDSDFRSVYEQDLRLHREALNHLGDDPVTVFAAVVRGTNAAMGRVASSAQVRYVDLPDDPTATPEDSTFAALIPEDTKTATFALQ